MIKEAKIGLALVALFVGLIVLRLNFKSSSNVTHEAPEQKQEQANTTEQEHEAPSRSRPKTPIQKPEVIKKAEENFSFKVAENLPQEQKELKSLENMTRALYIFSSNDQRPESLVKKLNEAGLKPKVAQDFNEDTGKMIVVETDEALPGTRYFHAQYFEDENKKPFLQHMSFEFRPGEKSLQEAVGFVQKAFPESIGPARYCKDDFAMWSWGEMTAWCHKLDQQDIEEGGGPHRAYGPEDVGAIRCTIEQNPHPQEDICNG